MDNIKTFSLSDVDVASVITEDSIDYAIAKIAVLSDGKNSHKVNITKEILMRDGKTILSKPVLAKYNKYRGDVMSHEVDEVMIGYIPENQEPQFVENELGETVMYVDAVISKIYAMDVYKLFVDNNFRNASVEMSVDNERPSELGDGSTDIDGLYLFGITVLGQYINGSDKNANIKIVKFSSDKATEYYTKEKALRLSDELRRFAESLDSKDNNDERTNPMENENVKQFEDETKDDKDVVMSEEQPKEEPKSEESKEMADPKEEDAKTEDKKMSETAEMAEDDKKEDKEDPKEDEKEMSCGGEKEMDCGGEKKFSLEQFASEDSLKELSDEMAEVVKMESADEVIKKFAEKVAEIKELSEKVEQLTAQNTELVEFQTKTFEAERDAKVNEILAEVKNDLEPKQFEELLEESKEVELSNITAFSNRVKAFAYENSKNRAETKTEDDGVFLMASAEDNTTANNGDVFERLSKKYK